MGSSEIERREYERARRKGRRHTSPGVQRGAERYGLGLSSWDTWGASGRTIRAIERLRIDSGLRVRERISQFRHRVGVDSWSDLVHEESVVEGIRNEV